MKRLLVVAFLWLICGTASAGDPPAPGPGAWSPIGDGLWQGSTWVWHPYHDCYGWHYDRIRPVVIIEEHTDIHDDHFWEKEAARKAHLKEEQIRATYLGKEDGENPLAYQTNSLSVYQRGVNLAIGGNTLFKRAAYPQQDVDPAMLERLYHNSFRLAEQAGNGRNTANSEFNTLVRELTQGNTEAARIRAKSDAVVAFAQSLDVPERTETYTEKVPAATPQPYPEQPPPPPQPYPEQPPPPPQGFSTPKPADSGQSQVYRGQVAMQKHCANCHAIDHPKGDLMLTVNAMAAWDEETHNGVADEFIKLARLGKMPKDHKIDEPTTQDIAAFIRYSSVPLATNQ